MIICAGSLVTMFVADQLLSVKLKSIQKSTLPCPNPSPGIAVSITCSESTNISADFIFVFSRVLTNVS